MTPRLPLKVAWQRLCNSYYGWRITALAALAIMLTGPGQTIGASVFVDHMIADLELSRSQVSLAYLYGTIGGAMALTLVGRSIDRFGVRWVMAVTGVLFGIAIAGMSGVTGFVSLTIGFVGIRLLGQGVLNLTATTSVAFWFEERRGLALGIATAAGAGLMSLVPLIVNYSIGHIGWRGTWLAIAPVVGTSIVVIALVGMRNSPAELGLEIDGKKPPCSDSDAIDDESGAYNKGVTATAVSHYSTRGEALRSLAFWAIVTVAGSNSLIVTGLIFHQVSLLGEQGLTPSQAAATFVPLSLASLCAQFAAGALTDRFSARQMLIVAMASLLIAMFLLRIVAPGPLTIVYAIVLGASTGMVKPIEATLTPRIYGLRHIGSIRGVLLSINVTASALGPYALAVGFEHFGAYGPALLILSALPVLAIIAISLARIPDGPTPRSRPAN